MTLEELAAAVSHLSERVAALEAAPPTEGADVEMLRDNCPYPVIAALFHQHCPTMPRISCIKGARQTAVRARWREAGGAGLQWFEQLFRRAGASNFLSGRDGRWNACSFDWLMKPANATKVLEGNYDNAPAAARAVRPNHADDLFAQYQA